MVTTDFSELPSAYDAGRLAAVAGEVQRDLQERADNYRDLFPVGSFDPGLFSTVALANVFSAPWLTAPRLRLTNRASLWAFGVDRLIDTVAVTAADVQRVVASCLTVADGGPAIAGDQLTEFLADIRSQVLTCAGYPVYGSMWRDELARMLTAMAREWHWARQWHRAGDRAGSRPGLAEYLDNADNFGFSFIFMTFVVTTDEASLDVAEPGLAEVIGAVRAAQQVMRLANDLATLGRDVASGDLNVLMFGESADSVREHIVRLTARSRALIDAVRDSYPRACAYIDRELDYNLGFYSIGDYWRRS